MSDECALVKQHLPENLKVDIRVFITGKRDPPSVGDTSAEDSETGSKEKLNSETSTPADEKSGFSGDISDNRLVSLKTGRPSVKDILTDEIGICEGSVAVCGRHISF